MAERRPVSPSQEFTDFLTKIVAVPKSEVDQEAAKWQATQDAMRSKSKGAKKRQPPKSSE